MASGLVLYGYWRSSAAYRVRIALNLKGLEYETRPVHLVRNGGEQHAADYRALNPQQMVPCLLDGDRVITQSLAIMEYLDEMHPELETALLPVDARGRAQVRALAMAVCCDIHPLGNLRVLQHLEATFGASEEQRAAWSRHWIGAGFQAIEAMLGDSVATGRYCHGETPSMADACLVPQVYNALRWKLPLDDYPTIARIYRACSELEAFRRAAPEVQPDAPQGEQ
ncbi:MAG: maleylacetoacetate isomerase [Rhodanobacter sp.]|jgi:maleylacetoacetate isomerase/maleylpyruvate isomerase|uniref:maleylacetoacetate isomerase n=1 Tax=Rhodanobacter sp. KK11 TaxID=3083255 RepID=UPI002965D9E1|nr:maleylacetoacetate isomerase [Rhodanobacter sp. KK11]MDW2982709.1 maleylacetoacetate isomerase [Rhodanobacter sp. KK11]